MRCSRIHGEVRQQAEVLEDVVAQVVGLVDDEDGQLLGLLCEAGDLGPDRVVCRGSGALDGDADLPCDRFVHVEHVARGEGDVVDAVQPRVELGGEVAADGCLAGAHLACEHADAAQLDEVAEPGLGLAAGAGFEEFVGFCRCLEGQAGEGEVSQVHQSSSLSFRMASGEGSGSGALPSASTCLEG